MSRDLEQALREKRESIETSKMEIIEMTRKLSDADQRCMETQHQIEHQRAQLLLQADEQRVGLIEKFEVRAKRVK